MSCRLLGILLLCSIAHSAPPTLYPCNGTSMQPLVWEGDRVLVWDDPWPPKANQLVVFQFFSKLTLHRVSIDRYGRLTTSGDNEFRKDGVPLMESSFLGVAHGIISRHYHGVIVFNEDGTIPEQPYPLIPTDAIAASLPIAVSRHVRLLPRPATHAFSPPRLFLPPSRPRS